MKLSRLRRTKFGRLMSQLAHSETLTSAPAMSSLPPESGHQQSAWGCLLCAKSGHSPLHSIAARYTQAGWPHCPLCAKSGHSGRFWILLLAGKGAQVRGASPVKLPRRKFLHLAASATVLPAMPSIATALDYPTRPVRIIVGFVAGQNLDITARLIGQWLSERLGQQFVIENRPGAGGNVGAEVVARAKPDGYTLLAVGSNNMINVTFYEKLNFDFIRDIAPVASVGRVPQVMEVNPSFPGKTVSEFIAYAKANPDKLTFASAGIGTTAHLDGELFKMMTGVSMVHVPYRGAPPALEDLMSGRVSVMFDNLGSSIELIRAGKLRPLAVTSTSRSEQLPDIPTVSEFVPGYAATAWGGIGAPRNTPAETIEKLNREINAGLADRKLKARFAELGMVVLPLSPSGYGRLIMEDTEKWANAIKFANIKPD
jgi:tripartite-type tricarboxylate transporter receptor subunit TctC